MAEGFLEKLKKSYKEWETKKRKERVSKAKRQIKQQASKRKVGTVHKGQSRMLKELEKNM